MHESANCFSLPALANKPDPPRNLTKPITVEQVQNNQQEKEEKRRRDDPW
jgi:hypothetical protein